MGIVRLRLGSSDGEHLNVTFADGAPFTAEGGLAAKVTFGFRRRGVDGVQPDRYRAGVYYNLFERTFGLLLHREFSNAPDGTTWRTHLQLGTAHQFPFERFEAAMGVGVVFR